MNRRPRTLVSYLLLKSLSSLLVLLLMFEGMVTAFHLLNLPSDRAVLEGVCLLLFTAAGGFAALRLVWWRRPQRAG